MATRTDGRRTIVTTSRCNYATAAEHATLHQCPAAGHMYPFGGKGEYRIENAGLAIGKFLRALVNNADR